MTVPPNVPDRMPRHRVAVTVFCMAHGVDERDAGHAAEFAIRKALGYGAQFQDTPFRLDPVIRSFVNRLRSWAGTCTVP